MLERNVKDQRDRLYSVGDFVGYVECVGKHRRQEASEKKWRLMQVGDKFSSGDVRLLDRMQIEIYRPLVRSIRLVPRNKLSRAQRRNAIRPVSEKVEPFFPGYAFFSFSETDEHWREVFKMVGVRGLVCANNRPVDVPWDMIREIKAQEVNGAVPSETKLSEFAFLIGDHVRVRSGPFASFGGTIVELPKGLKGVDLGTVTLDELDESYRVHLLVDIFGRPTPVELPVSEIEKM